MQKTKTLDVDPNVYVRLNTLAEKQGETFEQLASRILSDTAEALERDIIERAEDERRWQNYLETGNAIAFDTMRSKLRTLAVSAAGKMEPQ